MQAVVIAAVLYLGTVSNVEHISPPAEFDNVHIQPLASDKHSSQFVIFVKKAVKLHVHKQHAEIIYILKGTGIFRLGEKDINVEPGLFIHIPVNTAHGVRVTSDEPLKVLSVQTPEFFGRDRVFIDD